MDPEKVPEEDLLRLKRPLRELFPPYNSETPWLVRLLILRDDIHEERTRLIEPVDGLPYEKVWKRVYVMRKVSISVGEVHDIFKMPAVLRDLPEEMVARFKETIIAVKTAYEVLEPIRNGLGGHVRPKYAVEATRKGDPIRDAIRNHGDQVCEVQIDIRTGKDTDLRGLSHHAFLFIWPELTTLEEYLAKIQAILDQLGKCLHEIVHGIDALLYLRWRHLVGGAKTDALPPSPGETRTERRQLPAPSGETDAERRQRLMRRADLVSETGTALFGASFASALFFVFGINARVWGIPLCILFFLAAAVFWFVGPRMRPPRRRAGDV